MYNIGKDFHAVCMEAVLPFRHLKMLPGQGLSSKIK